jgi:hypothetical protein
VAATGRRKIDFVSATGPVKLYDHNVDKDGAKLGRSKQQSNFFITINTNKRRFNEVVDVDAMKKALHRCFKDDIAEVLRFGPAHPLTYGNDGQYVDALVEKVEMRACVECGPVTSALHAHLYLTMTHWSQIQVDVRRMQFLFKETFNAHSTVKIPKRAFPAVMIKLYPQTDWGHIIAHYLTKQVCQVV